jgi:SNF2 family DNA or RNA helicase
LAEAAKVPDIVDMVLDAVREGVSVAVFVNFKDTLRALEAALPNCALIYGGQSAEEREQCVNAFQADETHVIVANIAAGGVGVSLHDVRGERPRLSLISPSFNLKEYIQTLGRIHRAGSKSPATQRVLVASKTIEEKVLQSLEEKRKSLNTLHAQPLATNP